MLVLYETPAGYALFKVLDEKKLAKPADLWTHFEDPKKASKMYAHPQILPWDEPFDTLFLCSVKLEAFSQFKDTVEVSSTTSEPPPLVCTHPPSLAGRHSSHWHG